MGTYDPNQAGSYFDSRACYRAGNLSVRNKKKKKFADYVLQWQPGSSVAIVEAKDNKTYGKSWLTTSPGVC